MSELRTMNGPVMTDHLALVEQCRWRDPANEMPDADETVIINCLDGDEPVWFGYFDGSHWMTVEGHRVGVSGWKPMPEPMGGAAS